MRVLLFSFFLALISADGCLTPDQDQQLKNIADAIHGVFVTTEAALRIAEFSTSDQQTKQNLALAINVLKNVDQFVVGNLTNIADEACGTCSEVTNAVRDSIDILIDMLTQIEPDWKDNPLFKAIVDAIHAVLEFVQIICPDAEKVFEPMYLKLGNSSCLTPDQTKQLEEATNIIDKTLKTTVVALKTAAVFEKNATVKEQLREAALIIQTVDREVVQNLTRIANETWGTCDDIVDAVSDMVQIIEDSLAKIEPDWATNPIFKAVVDAIDAILEIVKAVCPASYRQLSKLEIYSSVGDGSCLTPDQDAKLSKITYIIQKTLDLGSAVLDIAIYFEKNATIKEQLFEAKEIVDTVNIEVVQNLTKIIDETCGTCDDIVAAVRDMVQIITDSLEEIEPEWIKNPIFKAILKAVDAILDIVKAICDPATTPTPTFTDSWMPKKNFGFLYD